MKWEKKTVGVASGDTESDGFTAEAFARYYGAMFPDMDDGVIGLEITIDGGSNWQTVLDPSDGSAATLCASGSDPGWVDFSDLIRFLPDNDEIEARFTCASQSADRVITLLLRG